MRRNRERRGSALIEAALSLTLALTLLLGVGELGAALMIYQGAAERVRDGARYAVLNPDDEEGIRNYVAYGNPEGDGSPLFGLQPGAVEVEVDQIDNEIAIASVTADVTLSTMLTGFFLETPPRLTIRSEGPVEGRSTVN